MKQERQAQWQLRKEEILFILERFQQSQYAELEQHKPVSHTRCIFISILTEIY